MSKTRARDNTDYKSSMPRVHAEIIYWNLADIVLEMRRG